MTDIPEHIMDKARMLAHAECGCAPGRRRVNGTAHSDRCNAHVLAIALALAAAEQRGAERAAEIAGMHSHHALWGREMFERGWDSTLEEFGQKLAKRIAAAIREDFARPIRRGEP